MTNPATNANASAPTAPDAAIRAAVLAQLARIAPEVDPATLLGGVSLREQADIDSMDFLNLVIGLSDALGVEVPEADYPKLATLDGCVAYLAGRGAGRR